MKIIKFLLGAALGVVLILVAIGFFLPSRWHVERSIVIKAPVEKIYPLVANFKTGWSRWNAFDKEDPNIQFSFSGSEEGNGAMRSWTSTKLGNGYQKITKADPQSGIDFVISMDGGGLLILGSLTMEPASDGTKVTWRD
ncbi:MAG TPA: SRPBCC family protein, partial [Bdellovibrio sp.]|nr:SRPBCC family protein [Bdellovibrio sp.]